MSLIAEVRKLEEKPAYEVREAIAEKITTYYNSDIFDDTEKKIANEILRLLAKDVDVRVRKILAENLKNNINVPHDIIYAFANDVIEVALPVLEFSEVLSDEDLIEIVKSTQEVARLVAIARRETVSSVVAGELLNTRNEDVVVAIFSNKKARIPDMYIEKVINEFKNNNNVVESLVFRGNLSIGIVEKLVTLVSGRLEDHLVKQYNLSPDLIGENIKAARELATINLLNKSQQQIQREFDKEPTKASYGNEAKDNDNATTANKPVVDLIEHLYNSNRLTYSIVLRALCEGNISFFEAGMARLAGVPYANAHRLICDENPKAFKLLYEKAHMPNSIFNAVDVIISILRPEIRKGRQLGPAFKQQLIEKIVSKGYDKSVPLMPYIMALVSSKLSTHDIVAGQ